MRISAMNQIRSCNVSKSNSNFKGLWGKSESDRYEDRTTVAEYTTHYYYPFKDETDAEIKRVVSQHEYSENTSADSSKVHDPVSCSRGESVSVMKKLSFTKDDFAAYLNNPKSTIKQHIIEKEIMENDLENRIHY